VIRELIVSRIGVQAAQIAQGLQALLSIGKIIFKGTNRNIRICYIAMKNGGSKTELS